MDRAMLIGFLGVGILLLAFFLNLFKMIRQDRKTYAIMNIIGAGMSCYASYMINYMPFVVLEGTWSVVAIVGFIHILKKKK